MLERIYRVVYAPHDRLIEGLVERRLERLDADAATRAVYHDRTTLSILANLGLSTQLALLGVCLVLGAPTAYLWLVLAGGAALHPARDPTRAARPRAGAFLTSRPHRRKR